MMGLRVLVAGLIVIGLLHLAYGRPLEAGETAEEASSEMPTIPQTTTLSTTLATTTKKPAAKAPEPRKSLVDPSYLWLGFFFLCAFVVIGVILQQLGAFKNYVFYGLARTEEESLYIAGNQRKPSKTRQRTSQDSRP